MTDKFNGKTQKEMLNELAKEFETFTKQYDIDMRGDGKVDGERGLITEVQDIKDDAINYPSITWLFAHKPLAVLITILLAFIILSLLFQADLLGQILGLIS